MNINAMITNMQANARRIEQLVTGISPEQARWRPGPNSWSLVEVINHLYEEELYDFRVRLEIILFRPEEPWPPIDPAGWVTARNYQSRDFEESIENYLEARGRSMAWLESLGEVDLSVESPAPWGAIRTGDMLAAWAAHDLHHMRQIVELLRGSLLAGLAPYSDRYAGDW